MNLTPSSEITGKLQLLHCEIYGIHYIQGEGTQSPDRVWGRRWSSGAPPSRSTESLCKCMKTLCNILCSYVISAASDRREIANAFSGSTSSPSSQIRPRSYSSRVGASNSLVSENAAELRRRTERSRMLESLASETSLDAEPPWLPSRTLPRHDPETPLTRPSSYATFNGERSNTSAFSRRQSYAAIPRQVGLQFRSATAPTIFDPSSLEADTPTLQINDPSGAAANMSEDVMPSNGARYLDWSEPSLPTSGGSFGPGTNRTERLGYDYLSAIDARHRRSTVRPPRPRSPLIWDDVIHLPELAGRDSTPSQATDLDARARRRSLMNLYNSSSSPTPVLETLTPITTEQPASLSSSPDGNLDLSAFRQGPILDSIQRYVDYDDIRARVSRLEAQAELAATSNVPPRARSPPSIPPLQFHGDGDFSVPYFAYRRRTEFRREVRIRN